MKYKVNFSGFAYVEADNPQEAEGLFLNDETCTWKQKSFPPKKWTISPFGCDGRAG